MNIQAIRTRLLSPFQGKTRPAKAEDCGCGTKDKVELTESRNERVLGTVGAGGGALVGRLGFVSASAAAGAVAGGLLGPVGAVLGGVVGAAGGAFVEFRDKYFQGSKVGDRHLPLGRMAGGLVGGVAGSLAGKALDKLPGDVKLGSDSFDKLTEGFSLKKLVGNLSNVKHTSNKTMDEKGATAEIVEKLKPGDVVMTNNDLYMDFEIPLKLAGHKGDWTHTALYVGDGKVVESLGSRGVVKRDVEDLVGTNHHVKVLRPDYPEGGLPKTIAEAESHIGKPYDNKFSLKSDDAFYCIEHTQKSVKVGIPEVDLEPSSILGLKVVSPETFNTSKDLETVYDTGSKFSDIYFSKFS